LKNQGRIDSDLRTSPLLCGSWIAVIGPNGPSEFKYRCRSWSCVRGICNYELRVEYTVRIVEDFGLPLVHVFMARRAEKGVRLSNWIKREVEGDYWRISSDADLGPAGFTDWCCLHSFMKSLARRGQAGSGSPIAVLLRSRRQQIIQSHCLMG
jgi:hypothetical protein